ncbi:MAG: sugar ABC transporter substrate-binding protein [Eubacteriales bacterium]|nr:sugar ABC transporter substrate-binding protein [Eubacteriales bacterium]
MRKLNVLGGMMLLSITALATVANAEDVNKYKVGFVVQNQTINYFLNVIKGIEDHQDDYGIEVQVIDGQSDIEKQITGVENLITSNVDCIVICPDSPEAMVDVVKESREAGIPVVSWSEWIDGSNSWLTLDNYEYGYVNGQISANWIKENFEDPADAHVMFIYVHGNEQLEQRGQGMMDAINDIVPDATISDAAQSGNTTEAGQTAVEKVIQKDPDLNVVVCANDSVALGAYEAMKAAGKNDDDCCITGCDADDENLKKIAANTMIKGTADIGAYNQGEKFCKIVLDTIAIGADKELEDPVYVDFIPVTSENISDYVK